MFFLLIVNINEKVFINFKIKFKATDRKAGLWCQKLSN